MFPAMIKIRTSFGDLDGSGGPLGCVTPWCEWTSDMKSNPLSDVWIPHGREDEACASLLSMQLQAVPTWTTRTQALHSSHQHHHSHRSDEYAVSVPLDRVESVDMEEGEDQEGGVRLGMFRVRVCSSQKLFDEIMLRGVLSSRYSVRMYSTSHTHLVETHPLLLSRVSRGIPRVFMVQGDETHNTSDRKFQISLSNDCIINSIVTSSDRRQQQQQQQQHHHLARPLPVRSTMRPCALIGLRDRIADEIAAGMAKVIRVRHVRLPRSVLTNIADLVTPRLFHNHGWVDTARITTTTMTVGENDTAIVLNGNGFPAFAIVHR